MTDRPPFCLECYISLSKNKHDKKDLEMDLSMIFGEDENEDDGPEPAFKDQLSRKQEDQLCCQVCQSPQEKLAFCSDGHYSCLACWSQENKKSFYKTWTCFMNLTCVSPMTPPSLKLLSIEETNAMERAIFSQLERIITC